MASIEQIKASDGTGNANVATVQSSRSSGSTTIIVDTVLGINPAGFAGTMGTPHTFTDPVTSETITVISEATAVDFMGHVDGANLEIDTIAPGYVDDGSAVGDIVIIRPTTQWSDNVAAVLEVAHADDGSITTDTIAEKTAAHGVTVDSLNIKDGLVVGGSGTGINNTSLDTAAGKLGAAWQTWTPTFTNFTKGSATISAKYIQIGKTVHFTLDITLSSSTMGTSPTFSLPVTSVSYASVVHPIGVVTILDSGTGTWHGYARATSTTTSEIQYWNATANGAGIASTSPMTWANNDEIHVVGTYEAA